MREERHVFFAGGHNGAGRNAGKRTGQAGEFVNNTTETQ